MGGADHVPTAGVVAVRAVWVEHVVGRVIDRAEVIRRTEFVLLRRVVVDDIEQHLDARVVEGLDHPGELADRIVAGHVAVVERVPRERHVAPIVGLVRIELVDRHQLDGCDAE